MCGDTNDTVSHGELCLHYAKSLCTILKVKTCKLETGTEPIFLKSRCLLGVMFHDVLKREKARERKALHSTSNAFHVQTVTKCFSLHLHFNFVVKEYLRASVFLHKHSKKWSENIICISSHRNHLGFLVIYLFIYPIHFLYCDCFIASSSCLVIQLLD